MKAILEIRPGEGGNDAKLLVLEQCKIYQRFATRNNLKLSLAESGGSWLQLLVEGDPGPVSRLLQEAGGHRWQRVPPTEHRGRVHTSTVTIAVFEIKDEVNWVLRDSDIETFTTKDSGPGGQHRNKTESCVIMRHLPTGLEAKASTKSQHQNRRVARMMLEGRVQSHYNGLAKAQQDANRKAQVGSGMRGDKVRTYREQDDIVTDHISGAKCRLSDILIGKLELLR